MKLLTYFLFVAVLTGVVGGIGLYSSGKISQDFDIIVDETSPALLALGQIRAAVNKIQVEAVSFALLRAEGIKAEEEEEEEELAEAKKGLEFWEAEFEKVADDQEEQKFVKQIEERETALYNAALALVNAKKEGKKGQEVLDLKEKLEVEEEKFTELITKVIDAEKKELEEQDEDADKTYQNMALIIVILTIAAIILSIGLGLFISSRITAPLEKLSKVVDDVSKGNLDAQVEKTSSIKEINVLADALDRVLTTMKRSIKRMKDGNK